MMGAKLITERYKKILAEKVKVSAKISKCHKKNSYIFLHNNDCKIPYIDIYIDLLSINFNLLSILQHYAYHWISEFEICTSPTIILQLAKYIVLSNIISVVSDKNLRICIQEPHLISKKLILLLHTLSVYSSLLVRYKFYSSDPRECLCTS